MPAGTGLEQYRRVETHAPDYKPMDFYSSVDEEQDLAEWLATQPDQGEDAFAGAYEADVIDLASAIGASGDDAPEAV